MTRTRVLVIAAAVAGSALGIGLDRAVLAQQTGITRTVLQRVDLPASTTHEAVMAMATIAPGASAGRHMHHGIEMGYVLEGTIVVDQQGRTPATKKSGEFFEIAGAAGHDAKNTGTTPTKILAVYLVEKGKPLAEPVK